MKKIWNKTLMRGHTWKRVVGLILSAAIGLAGMPAAVYAEEERALPAEEEPLYAWFSVMSSTTSYDPDGTVSKIWGAAEGKQLQQVKIRDDILLANLYWLCDQLELEVSTGESSSLSGTVFGECMENREQIPEEYRPLFDQAEEKVLEENGLFSMVTVKKAGKNGPSVSFAAGLDFALGYSSLYGLIYIPLGCAVQKVSSGDELEIWVPLTDFLNIFDVEFLIDEDNSICMYPVQTTVTDLLHEEYGYLESFYCNPFTDSTMSSSNWQLVRSYDEYKKAVRQIMGGIGSLNIKDIWEGLNMDAATENRYAQALALALCTSDEEEYQSISSVLEDTSISLSLYGTVVTELAQIQAEELAAGLVENSCALERFFSDSAYKLAEAGVTENVIDGYEDAKKVGSYANLESVLEEGAFGVNVAASTLCSFLSFTEQMNQVKDRYVDYVKFTLECLDEYSQAQVPAEGREILNTKVSEFDSRHDENLFAWELIKDTFESITLEGISTAAGELIAKTVLSSLSSVLVGLQCVALGWDLAEYAVNKVSGGAFDSYDHATLMLYASAFEQDARNLVIDYKYLTFQPETIYAANLPEDALDRYRALEWTRMKSYYITWDHLLSFFSGAKEDYPDDYYAVFGEAEKKQEELAGILGILMAGTDGLTQASMERLSAFREVQNRQLIEVVLLLNKAWSLTYVQERYESFAEVMQFDNHYYATGTASDKPVGALAYAVTDLDDDYHRELLVLSASAAQQGGREMVFDIYEAEDYVLTQTVTCFVTDYPAFITAADGKYYVYIYTDDQLGTVIGIDYWSFVSLVADGTSLTSVFFRYMEESGVEELLSSHDAGSSDFDSWVPEIYATFGLSDIDIISLVRGDITLKDYLDHEKPVITVEQERTAESDEFFAWMQQAQLGEMYKWGYCTIQLGQEIPAKLYKQLLDGSADGQEPVSGISDTANTADNPSDEAVSGSEDNGGAFSDGAILAESSSRLYTQEEILEMNLTADQCRIARNEIFARHGRLFSTESLQSYFDACDWYEGTIPAEVFDNNVLNSVEQANLETIQAVEAKLGYQ